MMSNFNWKNCQFLVNVLKIPPDTVVDLVENFPVVADYLCVSAKREIAYGRDSEKEHNKTKNDIRN